jgi:hypothetical protein
MIRPLLAALLTTAIFLAARADDSAKTKAKPAPSESVDPVLEQQRLAGKFEDFKAALLRLAQRLSSSTRAEDRDRAVILKTAIKEASEKDINHKFEYLIGLLKNTKAIQLEEAKSAMEQSKILADDIRDILTILLSDNRDALLKAERERIEKLLKFLDKNIHDQKLVRALTEGNRQDKKGLSKKQEKVGQDTKDLARAMSKDGKAGDSKDGKAKRGKSGDGKGSGQPKDGQPKDGQSSPKKNNELPPPQETPGRKQVQEANQDQEQAQKKIEEEKNKEASDKQDEAIQKLEEVRKTLEEILRQLREEELQRLLAALEARCQRMLALQKEVYGGTVRVSQAIAQNPDHKASRAEEQRSLQLSDREGVIVKECDICIKLLENEGSGVAFPLGFQEIHDDMIIVVRRLIKADVGEVTQTTELEIIKALEDMIEALKKAQSDKSGKPGQNNKSSQKLIDLLAELKLIRAFQVRVNSRTTIYAKQYPGEQANDPDIRKELGNLAQRQFKIFEATNNIARGKNQ